MIKHWFDTREGKLVVGEAAYEQAVEQSYPGDLVPFVDILTAQTFDVDTTYIEKPRKSPQYTRDDALNHGAWVLNILAQADKPTQLKNYHFDRISLLGLGMGVQAVRRHLGQKIWEISEALGVEKYYAPFNSFDSWGEFDFLKNAEELAYSLRYSQNPKPGRKDYEQWARQGDGPSPAIIMTKTGYSISELNEIIGFFNPRETDPEKLLDRGAEIMQANDGAVLNKYVVNIISRRKRGPGNTLIRTHFGGLTNYKALATEHYKFRLESPDYIRDVPGLHKHVDLLDTHFGKKASESQQEKLALAARFEITRLLVIGLKNSEYAQIAYETTSGNFIYRLKHENYHLTANRIKSLSLALGYYDIIWPQTKRNLPYLKVTKKQLELEKDRFTEKQRHLRERQSGSRP